MEQVIQTGDEVAVGEITSGTEDDNGAGIRGSAGGEVFAEWIHNFAACGGGKRRMGKGQPAEL